MLIKKRDAKIILIIVQICVGVLMLECEIFLTVGKKIWLKQLSKNCNENTRLSYLYQPGLNPSC